MTSRDDTALESRGSAVARELAFEILRVGNGGQLAPIGEYARRFDAGVGTIQTALAYLRNANAASLDARGRLGTVVVDRDIGRLWQLAMGRAVIGCIPMPYSRVFEGLSTGLRESLRRVSLQLLFLHVDGSMERIKVILRGEADFAVVSRIAADRAVDEGMQVTMAATLGRGSLITRHVLVMRRGDKAIRNGMRVGIDPASLDQPYVTERLCQGKDVQFTEVRYLDFEQKLLDKHIDAVVWHSDDVPNLRSATVVRHRLPRRLADEFKGRNTEAVLLVREEASEVVALIEEVIDPHTVRSVQAQVIRGLRVASY